MGKTKVIELTTEQSTELEKVYRTEKVARRNEREFCLWFFLTIA
jgi:hypothetical protein